MKTDVNQIYDVIEAKLLDQLQSEYVKPTNKDLGLDSLDKFEYGIEIDKAFNIQTPNEWYQGITSDMSLLDIVIYLHQKLEMFNQ